MRELININGRVQDLESGRISPEDRGFQFADGIYEFIRVYEGIPFGLEEHLERLERSAAGILLPPPGTRRARAQLLLDLIEQSGIREAGIYGQLTRGASRRSHVFPDTESVPPTELWYIRAARQPAPEMYEHGVGVILHPDERWAHCNLKTIALLPNCLAKERARRAGCLEAIFHTPDGFIHEGAAANVWCLRDGVLCTPPLSSRVLPGITRLMLLRACAEAGIACCEDPIRKADFLAADEAFVTSTTMELMPVTRVDGAPLGDGHVGAHTRRLSRLFREYTLETCHASAV